MKTETMREKLQADIGVAEKEKVKATYTLLESLIDEQPVAVDNGELLSKELAAELDAEYEAVERGEVKAYTLEDLEIAIEQKRKELHGKVRA